MVESFHAIKELLTIVDCSKCTTACLVIELLFRMANLRIAQPPFFQVQLKTDLDACIFG